ncbi:hypothetical protein Bbelb_026910 [Branchiostoma belcheri]|nr:hypothetical protein Bbelb_026910 [Branchiostoma belcheri]
MSTGARPPGQAFMSSDRLFMSTNPGSTDNSLLATRPRDAGDMVPGPPLGFIITTDSDPGRAETSSAEEAVAPGKQAVPLPRRTLSDFLFAITSRHRKCVI